MSWFYTALQTTMSWFLTVFKKNVMPPNTKDRSHFSRLPDDLSAHILSLLGVKSIGQCRTVSKKWLSLLSDGKFALRHLKYHAKEEKALFRDVKGQLHTIELVDDNSGSSSHMRLPKKLMKELDVIRFRVVGSCNGLVLALVEDQSLDEHLVLINFTTSEYEIIENHLQPGDRWEKDFHIVYGIGYDVRINDFKVVALCNFDACDSPNGDPSPVITHEYVYSIKRSLWTGGKVYPFKHVLVHKEYPCAVVNGALHWLVNNAFDNTDVIVAFDVSNEVFTEMSVPNNPLVAFVCREMLAVVVNLFQSIDEGEGGCIVVWAMNEYGECSSWNKIFTIYAHFPFITIKPLFAMSRDHIVALELDMESLIVYNINNGIYSHLVVTKCDPQHLKYEGTVQESLVSIESYRKS